MKRLAILFHRIGPYHFARARAAGKVLKTTLIEVFKSDDVYGWSLVPGADGFDRVTLFDKDSQPPGKLIRGIQNALDACRPDVVAIPGWADTLAFGAIQWCAANKVPAIVMSESTERDERRSFWKEWIKRRILKFCAAGLVGGQPHAEYLARLGMAPGHIFLGYDAVDNGYFADKVAEIRSLMPEIKAKHNLPENYFLASARFVAKKNLFNLIRAYAQYRNSLEFGNIRQHSASFAPWSLVLLGDGPLRSDLVRLISELRLEHCVLLPGFKQYDELPLYYGWAKAFIHASTVEQWGLVVNEAMASGLPVLVSNRCGCARDLVQENVNGFTFDPGNVEQLAQLLLKLSAPDFQLSDFGIASQRIISDWSPERFANGLSQAVETALIAPRPRLGTADYLLLQLLSRT